jgi:hypothetical protein
VATHVQDPIAKQGSERASVTHAEVQPVVPVKAWATFGAICVGVIAFVWIKWLTGPYLQTVHTGVTPVPGFMKTAIITGEVLIVPAALWCFWHFLIRPWRTERRLSLDGLLCIAFLLVWFQDPLTNWFSPWITWNSYLVNVGSWVNSVPGWISYGSPGHQVIEPITFAPALYVVVWIALTLGGCRLMTAAKHKWPALGPYRLFGITFVAMFIADVVIEGGIFMPLGFWTYAGGQLPIVAGSTYHALPLHEPVCIGLMMATYASFRYYRDDQGRTIAERGIDRIAGGRRQGWLRLLAVIGAVQLIFIVTFTVPVAFITAHARQWPADVQKRSYLTDAICGAGTNRACPGPAIPLSRGNSAYVTGSGTLAVPPGTTLPDQVASTR